MGLETNGWHELSVDNKQEMVIYWLFILSTVLDAADWKGREHNILSVEKRIFIFSLIKVYCRKCLQSNIAYLKRFPPQGIGC